jgi:predicted AAA+ superfamily ATPase
LLRVAAEQPSLVLAGEKPRLLDEWQDAPSIWDAVRFAVDREAILGSYILTGSAVPSDDELRHTGTGRIARLQMRPMSLLESGESTGIVSLSSLQIQPEISGFSELKLADVAEAICRGGWPASVIHGGHSVERARSYVDAVIESDISRVDGVEKNPRRVRLLMRSLARNESSSAAMTTIQADMATDEGSVSTNTIAQYLTALRRIYVIDDQESWAAAVRSKAAIRTASVRRFCDPSLPAALLGLTPEKMLVDFSTFGLMFESLVVRDLKVYANASGATVSHYRDARGLECDAIIEWPDGTWGAIEVKLDSAREDQAASSLQKIASLVSSQHSGPPAFLAIITATGYARRRDDGVYVIPVGTLGP